MIYSDPASPWGFRPFLLTPPEVLIGAQGASDVRQLIRRNCEQMPRLTPRDCVLLSTIRTAQLLERQFLPRNTQAQVRQFAYLFNFALHCVVATDPVLARQAGVLPATILTEEQLQAHLDRIVTAWHEEFLAIVDRVHAARRTSLQGFTDRELYLYAFECVHAEERIVSSKELLDAVRSATRSAANQSGVKLSPDDLSPVSLGANFLLAADRAGCVVKLLQVNADGKLGPGIHQVRDRLRGKVVHPTLSLDDGGGAEDGPSRASSTPAKEADGDPFGDRLDAQYVLLQLRAYLEAACPQAEPGSARALVLEHLIPLLLRELSLSDVHRKHGISVAALSEAQSKVLDELRRRVGRGEPAG